MAPIDIEHVSQLPGEEMLAALEQAAAAQGISDIHFNPEKTEVKVLWREYGVLRLLFATSPATFQTIQRRLKFKAKLKLNLETIAQDGQYTFPAGGRMINVRLASLPTRFGESYTLRFLDPKRGIVPLEKLGFPLEIKEKLSELMNLPNGLVLVTGPTGCGKTTTLYALLSTMSGKDRNIVTLEDPIEYELAGIVQSQVDPDHGYTFASGLRSVLRHDPDIILVGEIRDQETAQTAIDAALTGHLVLATLHTNAALEAIPRLLSMGVSAYTFAPALRAILAQRLVRTIDPAKKAAASKNPDDPALYNGQCALPELLVATPEIRNLILLQANEMDLLREAKKSKYKTMHEWGKALMEQGITTKEEIERVTAA